uniref:Uncharacterized protein n=1 Tax=Oryza punctata TaxID=4537 RepID=A0A0E0MM48_ORYPU
MATAVAEWVLTSFHARDPNFCPAMALQGFSPATEVEARATVADVVARVAALFNHGEYVDLGASPLELDNNEKRSMRPAPRIWSEPLLPMPEKPLPYLLNFEVVQ